MSFGVLFLLIISFFPFSEWLLGPIEKSYPYYHFEKVPISYVVVFGHYSKEDSYHPLSSQLSNVSVHRLIEGISIRAHQNQPFYIKTSASLLVDFSIIVPIIRF